MSESPPPPPPWGPPSLSPPPAGGAGGGGGFRLPDGSLPAPPPVHPPAARARTSGKTIAAIVIASVLAFASVVAGTIAVGLVLFPSPSGPPEAQRTRVAVTGDEPTELGALPIDGQLELPIGFDPATVEIDGEVASSPGVYLRVFLDEDLEHLAPEAQVEADDGELVIDASGTSFGCMQWGRTERLPDDSGSMRWTSASRYWIAMYVDPDSGEMLDEPLRAAFDVAPTGLAAPQATMQIDDAGRPVFSWDAVEGATRYVVVQNGTKGDVSDLMAVSTCHDVLAETDRTSVTIPPDGAESTEVQNLTLQQWEVSDDERLLDDVDDSGSGDGHLRYGVYAVAEDGTRSATVLVDGTGAQVPVQVAIYTLSSSTGVTVYDRWGSTVLVAEFPVVMADGSIVTMPVTYDVERTTVDHATIDYDLQGLKSVPEGYDVPALRVPYRVTGTSLSGSVLLVGTSIDDAWARLHDFTG